MLNLSILYSKKTLFSFFIVLNLQVVLGCENNSFTKLQNFTEVNPLEEPEIIKRITENDDLSLCNNDSFLISEENTNIYELNTTEYLVEIFCFVGAYQGSYQFLFYDANQAQHQVSSLNFTIFEERAGSLQIGETSLLTGYPEFDIEMKRLTVDRKARGLGDCGSYGIYQWQDDGFILEEYRYKGECDGVYIPVEDYPVIYP